MTVAVVGLGAMGSRIAGRLLDAGYEVVVWNRTAEKAKPLVERGAKLADSPADAAARAEALITMLTDPASLESVLSGVTSEAVTLIQMSTVGPAAVKRLAPAFPNLLDAPVLGSIGEAESGSLKIFVGGPEPLVEEWMPLLSVLGQPMHVGPVGAGSAAKLVANATLVGLIGLAGRIASARRGPRPPARRRLRCPRDNGAGAASRASPRGLESGDYPPRFALRWREKMRN